MRRERDMAIGEVEVLQSRIEGVCEKVNEVKGERDVALGDFYFFLFFSHVTLRAA